MFLALYEVLPLCILGLKVDVAFIAGPMEARTLFMLFESIKSRKPSITPVTVCHDYGKSEAYVWSEGVGVRHMQGLEFM